MFVSAVVAIIPPSRARTLPTQVRSGTIIVRAIQRGTTSHLTGSNPMARKASISSDTFIVAISDASPAPDRPATTIAVTSGPSSRK
jgi:hypothetical protein